MALYAPTPIDALTRYWQSAFQQNEQGADKPGFLAFWGKPNGKDETLLVTDSNTVNVDIQKSNGQTLATMIPRGASYVNLNANVTTGDNFTNQAMQFGMIEEEFKLTKDQEYNRAFGEQTFSSMSTIERRHKMANKLFNRIAGKVFRTHAYLAAQAILTGKHDQILKTTNTAYQYDFKRAAASYVDATGVEWNSGTPDIMGQIDAGCEWILANGYGMPNIVIMGQGMLDAFCKDTKIQALAKKDEIDLIQVNRDFTVPAEFARLEQAGFLPYAQVRTTKGFRLWIFTFITNYLDPADGTTLRKYMPTDQVLIAAYGSNKCDRYFGPRDNYELSQAEVAWYQEMFGMSAGTPVPTLNMQMAGTSVFDPRAIWTDAYSLGNRKGIVCRVQSAPIYAPTDVDAYYTIHDGIA